MASVEEWSMGYARQADADFNTYQFLEGLPIDCLDGRPIPACHRLQFLQSAIAHITAHAELGPPIRTQTKDFPVR
jgi:hypothetical protein